MIDMEHIYIRYRGSDRLLLVFGGWGTDARLLSMPLPEDGTDIMLCYDYRSLDFDPSLLSRYRGIRLLAWSMGVWVASRVLASLPLPWERRVAFNGTPFPVDDHRGIPVGVYEGTMHGFSDMVLAKFRRRMCGTPDVLRQFMEHAPGRGAGALGEELRALHAAVVCHADAHLLQWDLAVVGLRDRIFPPANQLAAWQGRAEVRTVDVAHYDAGLLERLLRGDEAGGDIMTKQ